MDRVPVYSLLSKDAQVFFSSVLFDRQFSFAGPLCSPFVYRRRTAHAFSLSRSFGIVLNMFIFPFFSFGTLPSVFLPWPYSLIPWQNAMRSIIHKSWWTASVRRDLREHWQIPSSCTILLKGFRGVALQLGGKKAMAFQLRYGRYDLIDIPYTPRIYRVSRINEENEEDVARSVSGE